MKTPLWKVPNIAMIGCPHRETKLDRAPIVVVRRKELKVEVLHNQSDVDSGQLEMLKYMVSSVVIHCGGNKEKVVHNTETCSLDHASGLVAYNLSTRNKYSNRLGVSIPFVQSGAQLPSVNSQSRPCS